MPDLLSTRSLTANGHTLHLIVATPTTAPTARLVIIHGYGDHAGRHAHVGQWFAERGVFTVIPDLRGHGKSTGKPAAISVWRDYLDDLSAVLATDELAGPGPSKFLLGHSHGGLIAVVATMREMLADFAGVILSAPYLEHSLPIPLMKHVLAVVTGRLMPGLPIRSGIEPHMMSSDQDMIADSSADPLVRGIATPGWFRAAKKIQAQVQSSPRDFHKPLLMLVPGNDVIANAGVSTAFFNAAASTDKTIKHYPQAKHELLRETNREAVMEEMLAWISARANPIL